MKKYGVLIADDSALMRRILKKVIDENSWLYVAGTARNGHDALEQARELKPSVISMDINMPEMDGISALKRVMEEQICPVVMVSSLTSENAATTFDCLDLGAFDFVSKPEGGISSNMDSVAQELVKKLRAAARAGLDQHNTARLKHLAESKTVRHRTQNTEDERKTHPRRRSSNTESTRMNRHSMRGKTKVVAIGISTGGPKVILDVLSRLPPGLNAPVIVVQHMPPGFTASFAERLNKNASIPFAETKPGMKIEPGKGYLAKGGHHLKLFQMINGEIVIRCTSTPAHTFIPSVDIMMESVLNIYGDKTIGVLMTGMGDDGAESMVKIRKAGGTTIAESEESAIVFGMPQQAIERGGAEIVAPLWEIADEISKAVGSF